MGRRRARSRDKGMRTEPTPKVGPDTQRSLANGAGPTERGIPGSKPGIPPRATRPRRARHQTIEKPGGTCSTPKPARRAHERANAKPQP